MATGKSYEALSASFMFLSFVTAALLLAVQGSSLLRANSAPDTSAPDAIVRTASEATLPEANPSAVVSASPLAQPSAQSSVESSVQQSTGVQVGIEQILSSAFHPVALIQESLLVVDLSDRQVSLFQNNRLQVAYDIAIGRAGWETPSGDFYVLSMQENPVWQNPISGEVVASPAENPLGSRWIGFWTDGTHQIGFHGTNQEEFIGQAVSHGCIRMRDSEIQALFTQVAVGTPVLVRQ